METAGRMFRIGGENSMDTTMIALIGYLASALLAVSLIVKRSLWFRWINLWGCFTFVVYGLFIQAFPVILTNAILLVINIVQLISLHYRQERFEYVRFRKGDEIIESFLKFYGKDIRLYFPAFKFPAEESAVCFMVLRDMRIANVFIAKRAEEGKIIVDMDYAIPEFRDSRTGRFIFQEASGYLREQGVRTVLTKSYETGHAKFLRRIGFSPVQYNGEEYFVKELCP
jgi:hypothetical protein